MKNEIKEGDYIDAIDGTNRITGIVRGFDKNGNPYLFVKRSNVYYNEDFPFIKRYCHLRNTKIPEYFKLIS